MNHNEKRKVLVLRKKLAFTYFLGLEPCLTAVNSFKLAAPLARISNSAPPPDALTAPGTMLLHFPCPSMERGLLLIQQYYRQQYTAERLLLAWCCAPTCRQDGVVMLCLSVLPSSCSCFVFLLMTTASFRDFTVMRPDQNLVPSCSQ